MGRGKESPLPAVSEDVQLCQSQRIERAKEALKTPAGASAGPRGPHGPAGFPTPLLRRGKRDREAAKGLSVSVTSESWRVLGTRRHNLTQNETDAHPKGDSECFRVPQIRC